ncbi:MAG: peptidase M16 [Pseudopedobacter saltans]|uniref:Peptidase M16 n=1 Tax=Pseudopedobacter saltans TaxID=151895 RepID=A0A2W5HE41_9SPHI|nr:MAG: peptidase M16 [Pseudopedobacter saltans]
MGTKQKIKLQMQKKLWRLLCLGISVFAITHSNAQNLSEQLPVSPNITKGKLANGLTYYIRPNNKPANKVELRLVVNAGSILENDHQQGLAHFMEHMNFNGTKNFPKNELVDYLQTIGVKFGADLNAYTSFDETVYILPIPTDNKSNIDKGFQVLADWAQGALLTTKDINEERNVVLEESRMGKGAADRMRKKYLPELLANSRYEQRLPIGKDSILKTFDPQTIRSFYHDWYRPNLMAVAVVGDITTPEAKALIEKYFGSLKNPAGEKPRTFYNVPPYKKTETMVVTDKEATNTSFNLVYSSKPKTPEKTLGDYRKDLVKNLIIQMINHRYEVIGQSGNPPFLYAYAYISGFGRKDESLMLSAGAGDDVASSINASIAELLKAKDFGFKENELDIAKKASLNGMEQAYNERNTTESGDLIGEFINNFLEQEPIPGIENEYKYYKELVPGITIAEINAEAKILFNGNGNYFAYITAPANKSVLTDAQFKTDLKNAFAQKVTADAQQTQFNSLLDKEPVAGKILSETKDAELGTTTYLLSNGTKVTVKPTKFKSDEILLSGAKKGGSLKYSTTSSTINKSSANYLSSVVESMGYGKFKPTEMSDFLAGKTVGITPSFGSLTNNVSGSSSVKDFETLLQLNYLQTTEPRKDADLFNGFVKKMTTQLQFLSSNPQASFIDTLGKTLYQNDPRRPIMVPTVADIQAINVDSVLSIYKREFGYVDSMHFFIVGNIDTTTLKPLLEKYVASLPVAGIAPQYAPDNGLRPKPGITDLKVYKGQEQKSLILDQIYGTLEYTQDLAMKASMMSEIYNIKIIENLRERIGGIYGGGSSASVIKDPYNHYIFQLQLPCGPDKVDTLLKAAYLEMDSLKQFGPQVKDLNKVKQARLESYKESIQQNGFWLSNLQSILFTGTSKERFLNYTKNVEKVSQEDIKRVANIILDKKNELQAILYPESSKK